MSAVFTPKKGVWLVLDADHKVVAFMLTKGLDKRQQGVAKSFALKLPGRLSATMAAAWKDHGVTVVYATRQVAAFWESAQEVAPVPFPRGTVWMAME